MNAMTGFAVVVLQMDEATGELDERFVKDVALSVRSEPDVFEDIVRGVIFLRVEEPEVFHIAGMKLARVFLTGYPRGDLVVLAHGLMRQESTGQGGADRGKCRWHEAGADARTG